MSTVWSEAFAKNVSLRKSPKIPKSLCMSRAKSRGFNEVLYIRRSENVGKWWWKIKTGLFRKEKNIAREMQWKKYDMTPLKSQISQMQAYFCSFNLDNAKFDWYEHLSWVIWYDEILETQLQSLHSSESKWSVLLRPMKCLCLFSSIAHSNEISCID